MERTKPIAVFMAFGTKGHVYPIVALAAAFASDQRQYDVFVITHSAHEMLRPLLAEKNVEYCAVSFPPVRFLDQNTDDAGEETSFLKQKEMIAKNERAECYSIVERIFGDGQSLDGDLIVINFLALEGWSFAEAFYVRCIVASPYVNPYSAPESFEDQFREEHPLLYEYLNEAPSGKVCWKDVIHWMWPLYTENWGFWRSEALRLSRVPFTDPITGDPTRNHMPQSTLLLYGFSQDVVPSPEYWPPKVRICGFWFHPTNWQFSCEKCREMPCLDSTGAADELCCSHSELQKFIRTKPIFIGLSSVGSMGFLKDPQAFMCVLQRAIRFTHHNFILFTAGYKPLESEIRVIGAEASSDLSEDCVSLYNGRLLCFFGSLPYSWLFSKCAVVIHHGGSGTVASALRAGTPQVICPFMQYQSAWAERMYWLGVSPVLLSREHLIPDKNDKGGVGKAALVIAWAIDVALQPNVKARAKEIAESISLEDGVSEALKNIKEELGLA